MAARGAVGTLRAAVDADGRRLWRLEPAGPLSAERLADWQAAAHPALAGPLQLDAEGQLRWPAEAAPLRPDASRDPTAWAWLGIELCRTLHALGEATGRWPAHGGLDAAAVQLTPDGELRLVGPPSARADSDVPGLWALLEAGLGRPPPIPRPPPGAEARQLEQLESALERWLFRELGGDPETARAALIELAGGPTLEAPARPDEAADGRLEAAVAELAGAVVPKAWSDPDGPRPADLPEAPVVPALEPGSAPPSVDAVTADAPEPAAPTPDADPSAAAGTDPSRPSAGPPWLWLGLGFALGGALFVWVLWGR